MEFILLLHLSLDAVCILYTRVYMCHLGLWLLLPANRVNIRKDIDRDIRFLPSPVRPFNVPRSTFNAHDACNSSKISVSATAGTRHLSYL